jgi:hypothetical protein
MERSDCVARGRFAFLARSPPTGFARARFTAVPIMFIGCASGFWSVLGAPDDGFSSSVGRQHPIWMIQVKDPNACFLNGICGAGSLVIPDSILKHAFALKFAPPFTYVSCERLYFGLFETLLGWPIIASPRSIRNTPRALPERVSQIDKFIGGLTSPGPPWIFPGDRT